MDKMKEMSLAENLVSSQVTAMLEDMARGINDCSNDNASGFAGKLIINHKKIGISNAALAAAFEVVAGRVR